MSWLLSLLALKLTATRLARAALGELDAGPDRAEAQLVLGEALVELGQFAEAQAVLADAEAAATDERQLVQVVIVRVRTLRMGLLRPDTALAVYRAARARVAGRGAREELVAVEAAVLMYSGHSVEALSVLEGLGPSADPCTRVIRALSEVSALVATGRSETAVDVARRGYADHLRLGDQPRIASKVSSNPAANLARCCAGSVVNSPFSAGSASNNRR